MTMPEMVGNAIVILLLVVLVVFAARSLWKSHKSGGQCTGDCSHCGGCGCKPAAKSKKES